MLLQEIGNKITALPATAQVASQQGKYLGRKFTRLARQQGVLAANDVPMGLSDEFVTSPFRYQHLGSLAYIGNAAVFDLGKYSFMGGLAAMYAWRSVYWSEQVSSRTRALLMIDWIVRCVVCLRLYVAACADRGVPAAFGDEIYRGSRVGGMLPTYAICVYIPVKFAVRVMHGLLIPTRNLGASIKRLRSCVSAGVSRRH